MSETDDPPGPPICKLSAIDPDRYDDVDREVRRRIDDLRWRLRDLENDGRVEVARTDDDEPRHEHARGATYARPNDRSGSDQNSRLFDECQYWDTRSEFALHPDFRKKRVSDSTDRALMPPVILLAYEGEVARWNLAGVFPCVDEETNAVITPEDYLTNLESGGDWRPTEPDLLNVAHEDTVGAITAHLVNHPEAIGPGWIYQDADLDVGVEGTIDLLYRHERDGRYLLVALKPNPNDRAALDRAFGELLRYRQGFAEATPDATTDAIDLAIAGPSFPEVYERIARDAGVKLVTVDVT